MSVLHTPLPPGRLIDLPGRGRTFARVHPAPAGAPTLLLLHGWTATADLNWHHFYASLADRFGLVAIDHRGHGRGLRVDAPFALEDCADDAAAVVEALGVGPVIAVGYSMGGPIAQLLWRRHRDLVSGLVLCATSTTFNASRRETAMFKALATVSAAARKAPLAMRAKVAMRIMAGRPVDADMRRWAEREVSRHDWLRILEAGEAIGRFDSRGWVHEIDVPTAVVATLDDPIVALSRQLGLADAVAGSTVHEVPGDHAVCVNHPERFLPALHDALAVVALRVATGWRAVRTTPLPGFEQAPIPALQPALATIAATTDPYATDWSLTTA